MNTPDFVRFENFNCLKCSKGDWGGGGGSEFSLRNFGKMESA